MIIVIPISHSVRCPSLLFHAPRIFTLLLLVEVFYKCQLNGLILLLISSKPLPSLSLNFSINYKEKNVKISKYNYNFFYFVSSVKFEALLYKAYTYRNFTSS